jgi:hypothetical protein
LSAAGGEVIIAPMQWCATCNLEVPEAQKYCLTCGSRAGEPPLPLEPPPPDVDLALVVRGQIGEVYALSLRLRASGMAHWILQDRDDAAAAARGFVVGLVVAAADLEGANRIREDDLRATLPDIPEDFEFEGDGVRCPACRSALPPRAVECGDCGLVFPADA